MPGRSICASTVGLLGLDTSTVARPAVPVATSAVSCVSLVAEPMIATASAVPAKFAAETMPVGKPTPAIGSNPSFSAVKSSMPSPLVSLLTVLAPIANLMSSGRPSPLVSVAVLALNTSSPVNCVPLPGAEVIPDWVAIRPVAGSNA